MPSLCIIEEVENSQNQEFKRDCNKSKHSMVYFYKTIYLPISLWKENCVVEICGFCFLFSRKKSILSNGWLGGQMNYNLSFFSCVYAHDLICWELRITVEIVHNNES